MLFLCTPTSCFSNKNAVLWDIVRVFYRGCALQAKGPTNGASGKGCCAVQTVQVRNWFRWEFKEEEVQVMCITLPEQCCVWGYSESADVERCLRNGGRKYSSFLRVFTNLMSIGGTMHGTKTETNGNGLKRNFTTPTPCRTS